jgi:anti-sigma B factor antagonist
MPLSVNHDDNYPGGSVQIFISGDMTIYAIADLKEAVTPEITGKARVALNLSQVEEMDSAGVQFIMVLHNHVTKDNNAFQLSAINSTVNTLFEAYGLSKDYFGS